MTINRTYNLANPVGSHIVQVCQNKTSQAEAIANYIKEGLLNDEAVVVFAGAVLRKAVISKMDALGLDMQAFKNKDQIKFFDAEFLLSAFLIDGVLEEQVFQESIGFPIQAAQLQYGKVRAIGGMMDVLWKKGQYDTAMQLEDLWNDLSQKQEFSLLCSYSLDSLDTNAYDESLEWILRCHKHLIPVKNYDLSESAADETMLDFLEAAWNRVVGRLSGIQNSAQMPY